MACAHSSSLGEAGAVLRQYPNSSALAWIAGCLPRCPRRANAHVIVLVHYLHHHTSGHVCNTGSERFRACAHSILEHLDGCCMQDVGNARDLWLRIQPALHEHFGRTVYWRLRSLRATSTASSESATVSHPRPRPLCPLGAHPVVQGARRGSGRGGRRDQGKRGKSRLEAVSTALKLKVWSASAESAQLMEGRGGVCP